MKILVYGAGAIGGYIGARLSQTGHDVTVIVRQVTAEAIDKYGLIFTENGRKQATHPQTATSIPQAFREGQAYDLIIMGMKSYDLKPAIDPLIAFCPEPALIMTTQNGIGVERPLIEQFGAEKVIAGTVTLPISKETSNQLVVEKEGGVGLAPTQPGQNIKQWVDLLKKSGIDTERYDNYQAMKWSKALLNIVGNASSAILNRPPSVVYKSETMFDLEMRMLQEALDVMDALKLPLLNLPGWSPKRLAFAVRRLPRPLLKPMLTNIVSDGRGEKMPSFYIDLSSAKGKSEVLYHNLAIAKEGRRVGVPTPVNAALATVLWKLTKEEYDWRDFDGRPKRLLAEVRRFEKKM